MSGFPGIFSSVVTWPGWTVLCKVHLIGQHLEPAARAVELLVGRHPEGVEGAGDHRHERPLLQPVDGVGGDGGDARLVGLGVGHAEVVNTLQVVDAAELYPHLLCRYYRYYMVNSLFLS